MEYYFSKIPDCNFAEAEAKALQAEEKIGTMIP